MDTSRLLLRASALRQIEIQAAASLAPQALMWRAARSAAELIAQRWPHHEVTLLCGPGNNGGDGFLLATLLHQAGRSVRVWALAAPRGLPADAAAVRRAMPDELLQAGAPALDATRDNLIVDALFGLGLKRELDTRAREWVDWANAQDTEILALDVPTGLDADTGSAQTSTLRATCTLTFLTDKPGLRTRAGPDHAGEVRVDDLGLGGLLATLAPSADMGRWVRREDVAELFARRAHDTHKGSFGTLGLIGGAPGMTGAALLAGRAALLSGAGKVFVGLAQPAPLPLACDPQHPELMLRDAGDLLQHASALGITTWVLGCGMSTGALAAGWLEQALRASPHHTVVLDADALTLIAGSTALHAALLARSGARVLTPHPLEAARMLGVDANSVQADRVAAAMALSERFGAWTVLKGAGTVVVSPDGQWRINGSGNAGLATAGTGDVLAGMLGALLAQGLRPEHAVPGAVWLHGAAADHLVEIGTGPIGLTASELADATRWLRNHDGH